MSRHPFKVFTEQLREVTVRFFMPVPLSAWNSGHTGQIFVKFYIEAFYQNVGTKCNFG
jgi:hypothetical protein